jgi:predicted transcriptional regulator
VQRIVAIAAVEDVVRTTSWNLWKHSAARGGGLSRSELLDYFEGKEEGYALLLGEVTVLPEPLLPGELFSPFTPPQSFRYLTDREAERLWA